uniref:Uncharacterized protein n=1 Tax=Oryza rufipogon TaxID=4529 RepID=A0A0E0QJB5_ORYRU
MGYFYKEIHIAGSRQITHGQAGHKCPFMQKSLPQEVIQGSHVTIYFCMRPLKRSTCENRWRGDGGHRGGRAPACGSTAPNLRNGDGRSERPQRPAGRSAVHRSTRHPHPRERAATTAGGRIRCPCPWEQRRWADPPLLPSGATVEANGHGDQQENSPPPPSGATAVQGYAALVLGSSGLRQWDGSRGDDDGSDGGCDDDNDGNSCTMTMAVMAAPTTTAAVTSVDGRYP